MFGDVFVQNKEVDALSMSAADIYDLGKTTSFSVAATETKADGEAAFIHPLTIEFKHRSSWKHWKTGMW